MLTQLRLYREAGEETHEVSGDVSNKVFDPAVDGVSYKAWGNVEEEVEYPIWELIWNHVRLSIDMGLESRI